MSDLIATLPMYDRPELREATDRLWSFVAEALRRAGVERVPSELTRARTHDAAWRDDRLLFSQACGFDVCFRFAERLVPVGIPVYRVTGCQGPTYRSVIVIRADDEAASLEALRGRRAAFNEASSHSGRVALAAVVAELAKHGRFFSGLLETGSHEASAEAVAEGRADVCALDCTSFALLRRARPELEERLRIIAESPACPTPPFVVGPAADDRARGVIGDALARMGRAPELDAARGQLLLSEVVPPSPGAYAACRALANEVARHGYDLLRDAD